MNAEFESQDSVVCEFNDVENPPDLTVQLAPSALLRTFFRQSLLPEAAFRARQQELDQLIEMAHEEHQLCLQLPSPTGAAYCLGNLALLTKVKGDTEGARKFAEEANRLASEIGRGDLAEQTRLLLESLSGP